jgi:hypothetical protein
VDCTDGVHVLVGGLEDVVVGVGAYKCAVTGDEDSVTLNEHVCGDKQVSLQNVARYSRLDSGAKQRRLKFRKLVGLGSADYATH